ncbi:MAG: hypothetical protein GY855_16835 [candidate division Zixibacteria bacterium]|nr:hypothetical protein [candidate division Zixibacteria bacterium]
MNDRYDIKFICDDNLGKLAKLLRALGYDTLFFRTISDGELIATALKDNRIIISRDRNLITKGASENSLILVDLDDPDDQLRYIIKQCDLEPPGDNWLTRCLDCNKILIEVSKEEYTERIPPYVYKTQKEFFKCSKCDKLYWKGTHHQRLVERLMRVVK